MSCDVISQKKVTAVGEVIAFRVYDSSKKEKNIFRV